jgi:hypothetical protein
MAQSSLDSRLRRLCRRVSSRAGRARGRRAPRQIAFGGTLLGLAAGVGAETINMAAALRAGDGALTESAAVALFDTSYVLGYYGAGIGIGLLALATGAAVVRTRALLPSWLAALGLALGVALLTPLSQVCARPCLRAVVGAGCRTASGFGSGEVTMPEPVPTHPSQPRRRNAGPQLKMPPAGARNRAETPREEGRLASQRARAVEAHLALPNGNRMAVPASRARLRWEIRAVRVRTARELGERRRHRAKERE